MKRVAIGLISLVLALFMALTGGPRAWASGQGHSSGGSSSASNPPGNNGTVKIEEYPAPNGDTGPDNDPHVTCNFQVNFFGFDADQHSASVTITLVAPTRGGGSYTTSAKLSGTRPPGNTPDGSLPVLQSDLSSALNGVTPQPNRGYHLRLDVTVDGGHKYKVFWLAPCASSPGMSAGQSASFGTNQSVTTTTTSPTPAPSSSSGASSGTSLIFGPELSAGTSTASSSGASGTASGASAGAAPSSKGSSPGTPPVATPSAAATAPASKLAFTGTDISGLVVFGLALIGSGFMLLRWRRKA